jgi:hypothetical protein
VRKIFIHKIQKGLRIMRKFAFAGLLLACISGTVRAGTVAPLQGGFNDITVHNKENTYAGGTTLVNTTAGFTTGLKSGDTIFGILRVDDINGAATNMFGVFGLKVLNVDTTDPSVGTRVFFEADPNLQSEVNKAAGTSLTLPGGTILALFTGDTNHALYNAATPTNLTGLGSLTPWGALGFTPAAGYFPGAGNNVTAAGLANGYWLSDSTNASGIAPQLPPEGTNTAFGVGVLSGFGVLDPSLLSPIPNIHIPITDLGLLLASGQYLFTGQTSLTTPFVVRNGKIVLQPDNGWFVESHDPINANVVPEPGAMIVWSLIGCAFGVPALRRRKKEVEG